MTDELKELPSIPEWVGDLTTAEFERLERKSTIQIPSPPKKDCRTCGRSGVFRSWDEEQRVVVEYRCNCVEQYRLSMELLSRGIDHEYQRLDWYDLADPQDDILDPIYEYIEYSDGYVRSGMGMTLHGRPGTGKSLMMYLLAKRLIGKGFDVYFTQHNHLLDLYKSGWGDKDDREHFKARCYRSQILFIDDFGTERETNLRSVDDTLLDQVLRTRASNDRPTFITTNLDVALLDPATKGGKYDARVRSLLSGKNETLEVLGEDYRPTRNKKRREEARMGISRPVTLG